MAEHQSRPFVDGVPYHTHRYRQLVKTPEGAAKFAWWRINCRLRNASKRKTLRAYEHVELRMTREEFMAWAMPLYEAWFRDRPNEKPSIDRKDSRGHYELSNLQMITVPENSRKTLRSKHAEAPPGHKYCGRCKQLLPFAAFKRVKPGAVGTFGLRGWCIKCYGEYEKARQAKRRKYDRPGRPRVRP